ncbi:MAG TPA: hypothetical protein VJ623_02860 [Holophagaceae bacterium]|nr:hypothetical protein [Holophagaceae bacterium]
MNPSTFVWKLARRGATLGLLAACMTTGVNAFAAAQRCSGNGYSVWCHTYWFGYTKCNLYDSSGSLVSEYVDPGDTCAEIA